MDRGTGQGWQAVVLAGGRASRLGGIDKSALSSEGTTLLERALEATDAAGAVAVVGRGIPGAGPHRRIRRVRYAVESPRFGGPVAALAAGLAVLDREERTLLLAGDLPGVREAAPLLLTAFRGDRFPATVDGVVAMDGAGRLQPLLGVYRTEALDRALALLPSLDGASMRALLRPLVIAAIALPDAMVADVDTPEDAGRHGLTLDAESAPAEAPRVA